jgi:hypothetical protein
MNCSSLSLYKLKILGMTFISTTYWMLTIITFGEFIIFKIVFCTGVIFAASPLYHQSAVVKNALR